MPNSSPVDISVKHRQQNNFQDLGGEFRLRQILAGVRNTQVSKHIPAAEIERRLAW